MKNFVYRVVITIALGAFGIARKMDGRTTFAETLDDIRFLWSNGRQGVFYYGFDFT